MPPIIGISDYGVCTELNLQVYLKDEGQPYAGYGANPTGSFKDRGMSVVASMACYYGLSSLSVPIQCQFRVTQATRYLNLESLII